MKIAPDGTPILALWIEANAFLSKDGAYPLISAPNRGSLNNLSATPTGEARNISTSPVIEWGSSPFPGAPA